MAEVKFRGQDGIEFSVPFDDSNFLPRHYWIGREGEEGGPDRALPERAHTEPQTGDNPVLDPRPFGDLNVTWRPVKGSEG